MEIEGFRLFAIRDKGGGLLDLRMFFTATNGPLQALYAFDAKSSKKKQAAADKVFEKAKQLANMKESVERVGQESDQPKTQTLPASAYQLIPNDEAPASILIGKAQKDNFSVRLKIKHKDAADDFAIEVPFKGEVGALKEKSFHGTAFHLVDSKSEVAKIQLILMGVGNTD